jgi:hypothetical protein
MGLPAAIEAARKLWLAEKRTSVPPEVAAKAIGYTGLSGASRAALASLRQYELIEYTGGTLALSNTAVDILVHPPESKEWVAAIRAAANAPDTFREISETHQDASDSALNAYLITRKRFSVDGAQKFIRSFRETTELVNRVGGGYDKASTINDGAHSEGVTTPHRVGQSQLYEDKEVTTMQFLLGGGMRAEVRFFGGDVQPLHIQRLEAYLKITGEALDGAP